MKKSEHCDICGREIHYEDDRYEQDDAYEIDGYTVCDDCIADYMRKNHYKRLIAS